MLKSVAMDKFGHPAPGKVPHLTNGKSETL
jgi:hypothetical protein